MFSNSYNKIKLYLLTLLYNNDNIVSKLKSEPIWEGWSMTPQIVIALLVLAVVLSFIFGDEE